MMGSNDGDGSEAERNESADRIESSAEDNGDVVPAGSRSRKGQKLGGSVVTFFDFPGVEVPLQRPEEEIIMEKEQADGEDSAKNSQEEDEADKETPPIHPSRRNGSSQNSQEIDQAHKETPPIRRFDRNRSSGSSGHYRPLSLGGLSDMDLSRSGVASLDANKSIRVGTFKLNGELKHYAIVPPLKINSQPDLQRLMDYWGVPHPNFLLETNESNTHRDMIISEENAPYILEKVFPGDKAPSRKIASWSKRNVMRATNDNTDTTESTATDFVDDWGWLNRYLERKVIQALASIVSAADMTNGWMVCHGSPSSNEKMLEAAMDLTGAAPYVIVVDDLNRYNTADPNHREFMERMLDSATIPLYEAEQHHRLKLSDDDIDFIFHDNYDVLYRRGSHGTGNHGDHSPGSNALWQIQGGRWHAMFPWKSGTHYIFSEKFGDFQPHLLGPAGYLCIHGSDEAYEANPKRTGYMIREAILTVKPCILFDNTGAETQMYARLIREIQKQDQDSILGKRGHMQRETTFRRMSMFTRGHMQRQTTTFRRMSMFSGSMEGSQQEDKVSRTDHYKKLKLELRRKARNLMYIANQGQTDGGAGAVNLGLADVIQIVDLYCGNPRLFSKIIVAVDPLNESPEAIVKMMTLSFARAISESREVGAGDADKKAVEQAWRFHYQLQWSKIRKSFWRNVLYYTYIVAGFATTLIATLEGGTIKKGADQWIVMGFAMTASFCVGVLNLTSADSQLQKIRAAQAKIEYEIMQFRTRVGKYSLSVTERASEDELENKGIAHPSSGPKRRRNVLEEDSKSKSVTKSSNISKAMHQSRQKFSQSITTVMQDLASLDLYFDEGAQHQSDSSKRPEFKSYVKDRLHIRGAALNARSDIAVSGLMTPEDYYEFRLLPLLGELENKEDKLRMTTRLLQVSSMMCSSVAVVLAAADEIIPIPAVIAGATGLFQFLKVNDYERRFEIASSAARELRAIDSNWDSLSDLDHQMRSSLVHMVKTTEQLALQYGTTSAIQVDKSAIGMETRSLEQQAEALSFGQDNA